MKDECIVELFYNCEKHLRVLWKGELCNMCEESCNLDCMDQDMYTE